MLRRDARLRKEYLYRKEKEAQEKSTSERKRKIRDAIEQGKPIPTELRKDESKLRKEAEFDEEVDQKPTVDDEYVWAGSKDPKIVITTSHSPSSKLKQFAKELRLVFPNCQKLNRGNYVMSKLVEACKANEVTDFIIVHEHRGVPDGLIVSHLPFGPTAYFSVYNVVMRHDIPNVGSMSEAYPHLVFHNLTSSLGKRTKTILQHLFPVPKEDSKRVITFANHSDYISFRHHVFSRSADRGVQLKEVGPRFELRLFEIKMGTVDQDTAEVEWKLRAYQNTSIKRRILSAPEEDNASCLLNTDQRDTRFEGDAATGPSLIEKE